MPERADEIDRGGTAGRIWRELQPRLEQALDPSTFQLWFAPLRAVGHAGGTLYLSGPDHVVAWVDRRYSGLLDSLACNEEILEVRLTTQPPAQGSGRAGGGRKPSREAEPRGFENFIVGVDNRLAHGAALAVAEAPGEAYNPLFIHGAPGLGKSHLLRAIAGYVARTRPELRVVMTTAENFTREFVSAVQGRNVEEFKGRHRDADLLLIDDVQFLEGKARTADELFHTFDALHSAGSQLVFSADRVPSELSTLELRLRERFEWGLTVEMAGPCAATRETFLRNRASAALDGDLDPLLIERLASRPAQSLRAVEGRLTRLKAMASLGGFEDSPEELLAAADELGESSPPPRPVTVEEIQTLVSERFGIEVEEMLSTGRSARLSRPRQIAMHLSRQLTGLSLPAIAAAFNRRDHTTVLYALKTVEKRLVDDPSTRTALTDIRDELRAETDSDRTNCQNRRGAEIHIPQDNNNLRNRNTGEIS